MGHYKTMFTPWGSVGSYENDELKEMGQCNFENGVLVPPIVAKSHETSNTFNYTDKVPCDFCGKPTRYQRGKPHQECRECRHKAQMEYINHYKEV